MSLLLNSNWSFGMSELISSIAAFLTFLAICVSLYLAQKSKTLKFKIIDKKIKINAFIEHQYQQINILNNGHTKFTCTCVGYYIDRKFYFVNYIQGMKKLDNTIIEHCGNSNTHITTEQLILPTYVQEGDILQLGLWPADYDFSEIQRNNKVYIFVIINGKIYKFYTGMRFKKFKNLIKEFKHKSLHNQGGNIEKSKNLNNIYFR